MKSFALSDIGHVCNRTLAADVKINRHCKVNLPKNHDLVCIFDPGEGALGWAEQIHMWLRLAVRDWWVACRVGRWISSSSPFQGCLLPVWCCNWPRSQESNGQQKRFCWESLAPAREPWYSPMSSCECSSVLSSGRNQEHVYVILCWFFCALSLFHPQQATLADSLVPKEFHIVKNRGVLPLKYFDGWVLCALQGLVLSCSVRGDKLTRGWGCCPNTLLTIRKGKV